MDASVIIPAIFFTVIAIVVAAKFLNKKAEAPVSKKKVEVSYDDVPPSRALGNVPYPAKVEEAPTPVAKEVEIKPVEIKPEVVAAPEPAPAALVVEEIGVVEEPVKEAEVIPEVQSVPEPEPIAEPEPTPEPEPEPIVEPEAVVEPEPVVEPEAVEEEPLPELIHDEPETVIEEVVPEPEPEPVPEPSYETEYNDVAAAEEVETPRFNPGKNKKRSKFENLMTKEEMEEEHRETAE